MIPAEERYEKQYVEVLGLAMAYVEAGGGDPIVLVHGNPSSSYEWRGIIPHLAGLGRCLSPDLIGMGRLGQAPLERTRRVPADRAPRIPGCLPGGPGCP